MRIREIFDLWKETWEDFELYQKLVFIVLILFGFFMFYLLRNSIDTKDLSETEKPTVVVEDNFSRKEVSSNYDQKASASINAEYEKLYKNLLRTVDSSYKVISDLEDNIRRKNLINFTEIENNLIAPLNNQVMSFYDLYKTRGLGPAWKIWFENCIPTYSQFSTDYLYSIKNAQTTDEQLKYLDHAKAGLEVFEEYIKTEYDNMYQEKAG